jgi:hypothetical protein
MTPPTSNNWSSTSLLRLIGYCLLGLTLFDVIEVLVPPRFLNPEWEFQTIGVLVERVAVPLLGLGLVFFGEENSRSIWEGLILKFLSWASLVAGVVFLLLAPLLFFDMSRLNEQINYQVNVKGTPQLQQLEQIEKQLREATTDKDIETIVTRFKIQGVPPNIKNFQKLKSKLLEEITSQENAIKSQLKTVGDNKRFALLKSFTKWCLGTLVSGFAFVYIWRLTRWARLVGQY